MDEINIHVDAGKKELKFSTMAKFVAWKNQEETSIRTSYIKHLTLKHSKHTILCLKVSWNIRLCVVQTLHMNNSWFNVTYNNLIIFCRDQRTTILHMLS